MSFVPGFRSFEVVEPRCRARVDGSGARRGVRRKPSSARSHGAWLRWHPSRKACDSPACDACRTFPAHRQSVCACSARETSPWALEGGVQERVFPTIWQSFSNWWTVFSNEWQSFFQRMNRVFLTNGKVSPNGWTVFSNEWAKFLPTDEQSFSNEWQSFFQRWTEFCQRDFLQNQPVGQAVAHLENGFLSLRILFSLRWKHIANEHLCSA